MWRMELLKKRGAIHVGYKLVTVVSGLFGGLKTPLVIIVMSFSQWCTLVNCD